MTRLDGTGDDGTRAATERALREAMARSVRDVSDVPDLAGRVHRRAGRLRLRRRLAAVAVVGSVTAVVAVAGAVVGGPWAGRHDARTTPVPASPEGPPRPVTASPSRPPASAGSSSPTARPTARPTATSGRTVPPVAGGPWGQPQLDEEFTASTPDAGRWTPYSGASGSAETVWSPDEIAVRGGALRLSVERVSATTPAARGGGVKLAGAGQRYGRWELRWRMTAGHGVTGQFLFLGEGPGGIGHLATVAPAERRLLLQDLVHGTRRELAVDSTGYHVLAMESTPARVRWLLDGAEVLSEPGAAPSVPVTAAVQALVQGSDCGRTPLPADCSGAGTLPQHLDVDYLRFWPYRA